MKIEKCRPAVPVVLSIIICSEENDQDSWVKTPIYDLHYSKIADLPCSPAVGMFINGLWNPIPISKITISGDQLYYELESLVLPKEKLEDYLTKAEKYLSEDGWRVENCSTRPK